jgi:hypothetical protein
MGPYRKSAVYSTRKISSLQDWLCSLCAWVMVVIAERSVDFDGVSFPQWSFFLPLWMCCRQLTLDYKCDFGIRLREVRRDMRFRGKVHGK